MDGGTAVDVAVWAVVPVTVMLVAAVTAVVMVIVVVKDTASCDRAKVLRAVAEVVRAVRGRR